MGAKIFDFRRITLFCLEKRLSKHNEYFQNIGGPWPLWSPPGYDYVYIPVLLFCALLISRGVYSGCARYAARTDRTIKVNSQKKL